MNSGWTLAESREQEELAGEPTAALVSLHFLRSALMTHWRVWVAFAAAGLALGLTASVMMPAPPKATATLVLAQEQGVDPADGLATDMTLMRTRALATEVIDDLDLQVPPETFQASVVVLPLSGRVMLVTVAGPDRAEALARARALVEQFFEFRNRQLDAQLAALVGGYQDRMDRMRSRVEALTARYESLSGEGSTNQVEAGEVLTERAGLNSEIDRLQALIEDEKLEVQGVRAASHLLDPPAPAPASGTRTLFAAAAGLIGGLGLGVGLVLVRALTSDRLRRRDEVAAALGVPVWMSVGPIHGSRVWHLLVRGSESPDRNRQMLVHALEPDLLSPPDGPARIALATVGNTRDGEILVAALAHELADRGVRAFLVDLTESGGLDDRVAGTAHEGGKIRPTVFRPEGIPSLASGPYGHRLDGGALGADHLLRSQWDEADVVLVLVDVDPAVGVHELASWADQVRVVVTAGRCSAERLRTAGELIRSAGLEPEFAVLIGVESRDDSLGRVDLGGRLP